jgi:hypothetical protein
VKELHASAIYVGMWAAGAAAAVLGILGLMWLGSATDPEYEFEDVVCVERPTPPIEDWEVEAWLDDPNYQRPAGVDCRYESDWRRDTP